MTLVEELVGRIRVVEHRLARADVARAAAQLVHGHAHALGNAIQVVDLASFELVQRSDEDVPELLADLRTAAERATKTLAALIKSTYPPVRTALGPPVGAAVAAAIEQVQPAMSAAIDLRIELVGAVTSHALDDELEAVVLACALDVAEAARVAFVMRERELRRARWIELVRIDSTPGEPAEPSFAPPSLLAVVDALATQVGGELSMSAGRSGRELVLAWPVAA